jgi:hypothetical protein
MSIETYEELFESAAIDRAINETETEYAADGQLYDAKEALDSLKRAPWINTVSNSLVYIRYYKEYDVYSQPLRRYIFFMRKSRCSNSQSATSTIFTPSYWYISCLVRVIIILG